MSFFAWWWWVYCCRGGVSGCDGKGGFHGGRRGFSFVWIFAVGWWRGHGFWFGYVLRGGGGGGNRWLQR